MLLSLIMGGALAFGQPQIPAFRGPSPIQPVVETSEEGWRSSGTVEHNASVRPVAFERSADAPEPLNLSVTVPATAKQPAAATAPAPAPSPRYSLMTGAQGTWLGAAVEQSRMTIYGWTEFSYTMSTSQGSNLPMGYNDKGGEFLLNQNYLHIERTIDTSKSDFQWGFVSDTIVPGSDYRFTVARGLFSNQLTSNSGLAPLYGFDPYQIYAQFFLPDLGPRGTKIEIGRFASHIGYEVTQAPDTPFVSHSYGFIYNPFTHTGVYAISQLNDAWSMGNGIATGNDTFIDPANRPTYLGQVKWAPPTGRASVTFNTSISDPTFDAKESFPFYNVYDLIVTYKFSDRSTYAIDSTYSHILDAPTGGATDWFGTAHYWTYQVRSNVQTILRAEAFKDTAGFRTGFPGWYTDFTAGITWKPNQSLIIRPSVRYDHNWDSAPFEGKPDLLTTALDVIVRW